MDLSAVKLKMKWLQVACALFVIFALGIEAHEPEYVVGSGALQPHIVLLDHGRQKRDTPAVPALALTSPKAEASPPTPSPTLTPTPTPPTSSSAPPAPPAPAPPTPTAANATVDAAAPTPALAPGNVTDDVNRTTKDSKPSSPPVATVTQVPPLGANGAGQRWPNLTDTKVSDPIPADDNFTDVFETPERVKAEQHINNLTYDHHSFYNSTFIGELQYFNEHWNNISAPAAAPHEMLSNSHRRATTVKLSFPFPFYGNWIQTVTVATGGFIYTGEHTHAWLAATQYIAPLMANFDTALNVNSFIKLSDDGEKFTAFWENVALREERDKLFTFAVTLYKNGDIAFAYKHVPLPVQDIDDSAHPVKIGISDAYLTDKIIFYVRRKTIYEYHRVSFKNYEISNHTVLRLTALPTCLQYASCGACLNHDTGFNCAWCENIQKCSSGTDRNKQDWQLRNCDKSLVTNATSCPAGGGSGVAAPAGGVGAPGEHAGGVYVTDGQPGPAGGADVRTLNSSELQPKSVAVAGSAAGYLQPRRASAGAGSAGGMGGVVAACAALALVSAAAAWALYAFKHPHSRSGQLFIKYRPSQWNWRRGEARYTAATIHM